MAWLSELSSFGIVALILCILLTVTSKKGFPPGPTALPIVGHLPFIAFEPHKKLVKWKEKYGPIVGVYFGNIRCVIISDCDIIKEAMNDDKFVERPVLPLFVAKSGGIAEGILSTSGRKWREQRRFALRHLRNFGFGKTSMESIFLFEVVELIQSLKNDLGTPITTTNRFNVAVGNSLWTIVNGRRFEQDDPKLAQVIRILTEDVKELSFLTLVPIFGPALSKYLPGWMCKSPKTPFGAFQEFLEPYLSSHFESHIPGNPQDFIDAYIDEIHKTTDPDSSFHIEKSGAIVHTIVDLVVGGLETVSTALSWTFIYLATHPEVQEKLATEVGNVVGNSRLPSLADRPNMPYVEAVLHEVIRVVALVPFAFPRSTTDTVKFHGYTIPENTMVIANLYSVHYNVDFWGDPENFRPERFLSKCGTKFEKRDGGFMAFSTGKRVCPGESFSWDEYFLFTTSLLQAFRVSVDPTNPPSLDPAFGFIFTPKPHVLIFTSRNGTGNLG